MRIGDFEVGRVLHRSTASVLYAARQSSLGRDVALEVFADTVDGRAVRDLARRHAALEHPNVVAVYGGGDADAPHLASRLLSGESLRAAAAADPAAAHGFLAGAAAGLDALHAAGIVHGRVDAAAIRVVDGHAIVTAASPLASGDAADDIAAFATLAADVLGAGAPAPADTAAATLARIPLRRARGRTRRAPAAAAALLVAGVPAALVIADRESSAPVRLPTVAHGRVVFGSSLSGAVRPVDCNGEQADSLASCVVLATDARGNPVPVPRDGLITAWTVRGASGPVALETYRRSEAFLAFASQHGARAQPGTPLRVADAIPVRRGDLIGLRIDVGGRIGLLAGRPPTQAARRVLGRTGERGERRSAPDTVVAGEVALRLEFRPGARRTGPGPVAGAAAQRLPAGRIVGRNTLTPVGGGTTVTVTTVVVDDRVALDLLVRGRRTARTFYPLADVNGRFESNGVLGPPGAGITNWRNPDGSTLALLYVVRDDRLEPRS